MLALLALIGGLGVAQASDDQDLEFDLEGYYRIRGHMFKDLFAVPLSGPQGGRPNQKGRYMTHRLRLQPVVKYEKLAKFTLQADVLDDVVWGDNASLSSTALFAGDPSTTGVDGTETADFQVNRAWVEFNIPVGIVRAGRQASHWGMGLLANNGDGFDDMFGENYGGSTYDRVIFATKPLAIAQKIVGAKDSGTPLFLAIGVDRLVEDSLDQYYGYSCPDFVDGPWVEGTHDQYDPRCDVLDIKGEPGRDGVADLTHGYTETRDGATRPGDWWADGYDDVYEMIYALIYKGEDIPLAGSTGDLVAGVYSVNRRQQETDSNIWIMDAYLKLRLRGLMLESEVLHIGGETNAIAIPGSYDPSKGGNPLAKEADIWAYVARAGYEQAGYAAMFETGYASGDNNVADKDFTGRAIHPDYNVGLIFYDQIMSRVTAATWGDSAAGLWSKGGVYNSRYIFPSLTLKPMNNWNVHLAYLKAWPDRPDGANILCKKGDKSGGEKLSCSEYGAKDDHLVWEVDVGIQHKFHGEHVLLALEAGYAETSDRIPVERAGLNPKGKFTTVQSRIAFEF
jgi:hypothetical protein